MELTIKGGIKFALQNPREVGFEGETNDCTVRSLAAVTGVPYRDAHAYCKRWGRRDGHGTLFQSLLRGVAARKETVYGYRVFEVECKRPLRIRNMFGKMRTIGRGDTLKQTLRRLGSGRYIVVKRGHALAVKDGVVHDIFAVGASSRVTSIWKFVPSSQVQEGL